MLARLGLAGAVVMTAIHLVGAMMGGSVLPALAERYLLSSPAEAPAALQIGGGFYLFYEALLAPTFLTLAATVLLFGTATLLAGHFPAWLGWGAVVSGLWTAVGGVAFVFAGPLGAAEIMGPFMPGFLLSMVWVFTVGVFLWRMARTDEKVGPPRERPVVAG